VNNFVKKTTSMADTESYGKTVVANYQSLVVMKVPEKSPNYYMHKRVCGRTVHTHTHMCVCVCIYIYI
jgi:hypothetical protein